jgi:hypothetical protein
MEGMKKPLVDPFDQRGLQRSTRIVQRYAELHGLLVIAHEEPEHYSLPDTTLPVPTSQSEEMKVFHGEVSRLAGYFSRQRVRFLTSRKAISLVESKFDSVVVATDSSALQVTCLVWPTLLCGGQLVIYSQFLEVGASV